MASTAKPAYRYKVVEHTSRPAARSRGRPRGKPTPLTQEERRDRNAELERGRRDNMADAFDFLRSALGHDATMTRVEALQSARNFIGRDRSGPSAAELRRQNECLMQQIEILQERLGVSSETYEEDPECSSRILLANKGQTYQLPKPSRLADSDCQSTSECYQNYTHSESNYEKVQNHTDIYPSAHATKLEYHDEEDTVKLKYKPANCQRAQVETNISHEDVPTFSEQTSNGLHFRGPYLRGQSQEEYDNSSYTSEEYQYISEHNPMLSSASYCDVKALGLYCEMGGAEWNMGYVTESTSEGSLTPFSEPSPSLFSDCLMEVTNHFTVDTLDSSI